MSSLGGGGAYETYNVQYIPDVQVHGLKGLPARSGFNEP